VSENKNLKPGWKFWRFDQMATNVNVRIENPSESGMEHYVGLEHLDADSLKIRRWGTPDDVEATKLMFKKGDIIFGRRRAYQRKLGVAEFDGICSAHAMVLRAKPEVVLPEFLPFFMQSDLFMNRAVQISVGSLSPTINWRTLAAQEFALPPQDHQKRTISLLTEVDALADRFQEAVSCLDATVDAFFADRFSIDGGVAHESSNAIKAVAVGAVTQSVVPGRTKPREFNGDIPWLVTADLVAPSLYGAPNALLVAEDELRRVGGKVLPPGAVVMTCVGNLGLVSRVHMKCSLNQQLHGFIATPGLIDPEYLAAALRSQRRQITSLANTTTVPYLNKENCESIRIPVPTSIDEQKSLAAHLRQFDVARVKLITRLNHLRSLRGGLLAEVTQ